jgi:hypothetical protein
MNEESQKPISQREAGMMLCTGFQGVGKTYQNMHTIKDYVKDKLQSKVKGRQCIIFDTNGEYTREQFAKAGIENFEPKKIAIKDIRAWSSSNIIECRRIDAKDVKIPDKIKILELLIRDVRNGMLVVEDINTYILSVTHMQEIVGGLVNLRHRGVDILVSYQSLRAVEPRMWQNAAWIRMHYQADSVNDIKNKVTNAELMKIAQVLVNNRYKSGDKRFFVFILNRKIKIEGDFTAEEFKGCIRQYLNTKKTQVKDYAAMNGISIDESYKAQVEFMFKEYYGNA